MRNGKLMATISIDNDIPVFSAVIKEMPVTPPSIKLLGSKNPLSPKPAEVIPIKINMASLTTDLILNLDFNLMMRINEVLSVLFPNLLTEFC